MPGISASWAPWAGTPMQRRNRPMNEPISDEGQEQTVMRMLLDTPLVQRQGDPDAGDFSKGFRDYGSQNFTIGNMLEDGAAGGAMGAAARIHPAAMAAMIGMGALGSGANAYGSVKDAMAGDMRGSGRKAAAAIGGLVDFTRAPAMTPIGRNEDPGPAYNLNVDTMALPDEEAMQELMMGSKAKYNRELLPEFGGRRMAMEKMR